MNMSLRRNFFATSRIRLHAFAVIGALCLLTSASVSLAGAAVYRWVDDQGKVHYAEVVPQRYQGVAKRVGAEANEPSAEQRRDALARAQREKCPKCSSRVPASGQATWPDPQRSDGLQDLAALVHGKHRVLRSVQDHARRHQA